MYIHIYENMHLLYTLIHVCVCVSRYKNIITKLLITDY